MTRTRKNVAQAAEREQKVLDTLNSQGPLAPNQLRTQSGLSEMSHNGFSYLIDRLEKKGKVSIYRKGQGKECRKVVRLAGDGREVPATRFAQGRRGQMGAEVDDELVERAAQIYEEGHKIGPFRLAELLGVSPREAISCVGILFAQGRIRAYREVHVAVNPFPKKAA